MHPRIEEQDLRIQLNAHLGVTWPDLRKGQMPESLFNYLREID